MWALPCVHKIKAPNQVITYYFNEYSIMIDLKANNSDKIYLEKARLFMQNHILKEKFNYSYQAVKKETCF